MSIESILVPKQVAPKHYLTSLDGQIQSILSNKNLPPDVKFSLYNQVLSKWHNVHEDLKKPTRLAVTHREEVSNNNPQKRVTTADKLLQFVEKIPSVSIDSDGIVSINGVMIRKSNINKIITDLTQNSKTRAPVGTKQLAKVLKEFQVPLDYITNENRFSWFVDQFTEFPPSSPNQSWSHY